MFVLDWLIKSSSGILYNCCALYYIIEFRSFDQSHTQYKALTVKVIIFIGYSMHWYLQDTG